MANWVLCRISGEILLLHQTHALAESQLQLTTFAAYLLVHVSAFQEFDGEKDQTSIAIEPRVATSHNPTVSKHALVVCDACGFGLGALLLIVCHSYKLRKAWLRSRVLFGRRSCLNR